MNNELFIKVREWAAARNIILGSSPVSQFAKLISEHGELAGHLVEYQAAWNSIPQHAIEEGASPALLSEMHDKIKDDIGDALVVMTIISAQLNLKIEEIFPDSIESGSEFMSLTICYGMMADAVLKSDLESFQYLISVSLSLLSAMSGQIGASLNDCLSAAYNDIKDRKGVMYNGTFVKSTDDRYKGILAELGLSE